MAGIRIGGLASGMDTDTTVKQLMDAEKIRLNKYNQSKQIKLWTQEAYNNINKDMANFILDTKKEFGINDFGSMSSASWTKKVTSSSESVLTATSTMTSMMGSHNIKVHQLAKGVNLASTDKIAKDTIVDADGKFTKDGSVTFKVKYKKEDGLTFEKDILVEYKTGETLSKFAQNINSETAEKAEDTPPSGDGKSGNPINRLFASYDSGAERFFLSTANQGEDAKIEVTDDSDDIFSQVLKLNMPDEILKDGNTIVGTKDLSLTSKMKDILSDYDWSGGPYTFKINGGDIIINETDTVADLVSKLDGVGTLNASLDGDNKLNLQASGSDISVSNDTAKLFSKIGLSSMNKVLQGQNAIIDFDEAKNIEYKSNDFNIGGISISAKTVGTSTVDVKSDVDGIVDKIKSFVDKYNELIGDLNKKTGEKRYRDYKPLSDEEKQAMDEDTIKLWEEKAKSGLLKNNEHIGRSLEKVRNGLYEGVYDDYSSSDKIPGFNQLTQIGITTGEYKDKGKLKIDEGDLRKAIETDVDGVMNLLFKKSDISDIEANKDPDTKIQKREETGLINRLYDDLADGMKDMIDKAGPGDDSDLYRKVKSTIMIDFVTKGSLSLLDKDILSIGKQISSENTRLARKENYYYKKFAALEKAMNKMNSQSSWLASQMGM